MASSTDDGFGPVYARIGPREGSRTNAPPSFAEVLGELQALHDKKSADYGADNDPLANIRESEKYGIPAWLGAVIRGGDKVKRIQTFAKKGKLENESVEDSIRDLAVYAIIALQLYREKEAAK